MGKWALGIKAKRHEHVSAVSPTLLGEVDSFRGSQGHCRRSGGPTSLHQNVLKSPESLSRGSRNHQGAAVWALPPPFTDRKRKVQRETASSPRSHSLLRMEGKPEDKFGCSIRLQAESRHHSFLLLSRVYRGTTYTATWLQGAGQLRNQKGWQGDSGPA